MNRIRLSMTLTKHFASDLIGGALTTAALFALLCWDFARQYDKAAEAGQN